MFFFLGAFPAQGNLRLPRAGNRAFRLYLLPGKPGKRIPLQSLARSRRMAAYGMIFETMDLFNNPVGCLTSLADLADFIQKSTKSAVFQRKLFNN
jgi:hypothetical protein